MDPAQVFAVLTAIIFSGITLGFMAMAEFRAQTRQKEEQQRELLLTLFRISKKHMRHVDAVGMVLLRALRQGGAGPDLIAEIERELERAKSLSRGEDASPLPELPAGEVNKRGPDE